MDWTGVLTINVSFKPSLKVSNIKTEDMAWSEEWVRGLGTRPGYEAWV